MFRYRVGDETFLMRTSGGIGISSVSKKTNTELLREKVYARLGIDPLPEQVSPDRWRATEWCHEFERLCRNRMFMGGLRYGRLGAPGKPQFDRCKDIKRRVSLYENSGNLEYLVDAANLCQCEFVEGDHPDKHFAAEDDGEHTERKKA